jgi:hypothetical protein
VGQCYRYPPVPIVTRAEVWSDSDGRQIVSYEHDTMRPVVNDNEYCGEEMPLARKRRGT